MVRRSRTDGYGWEGHESRPNARGVEKEGERARAYLATPPWRG